jgi:predicted nucleotide-binding protein (sugar kinase/HSP70/actin superfamily)
MSRENKTFYIPYMGDHSHVLRAALTAHGARAEVMPPPDDESVKLGLDLVLGRECSPCMVTVGDMIRVARRPDFDPARSVMFMSTAPGPCRFGQYSIFQRHLLDESGLKDVEIASPNSANSYQDLVDDAGKARMLTWDGVVALDLLQALVHRWRPYERERGQCDALYITGLARILASLEQRGKGLGAVMAWCADQFGSLPVDAAQDRPLIGVLGEIYVRFSPYSNQDVIRRVEALGGEVMLANMMEWLYFTTWNPGQTARRQGDYLRFLKHTLIESIQRYREHKLARPVVHLLRHAHETPPAKLISSIQPYIEPAIQTETILTIGKAIEMAELGASGILAVMPFSCMPGILTAAISPRVRAGLDNIPWLDLSFDLQKSTNIQTRLEAFMNQALHYQRRRQVQKAV